MRPDFHAQDVSTVAFRAAVDAIAPDAPFVDVIVHVVDAPAEQLVIALGYAPSGIILRGAQHIRRGERRVFRQVPRPELGAGEDLVVATSMRARVEVEVLEADTSFGADLSGAGKAAAGAAKSIATAAALRIALAAPAVQALEQIRSELNVAAVKAAVVLGVSHLAGRAMFEALAGVAGKLDSSYRNHISIAGTWLKWSDELQAGRVPSDWQGITSTVELESRVRQHLELGPKLIDAFNHVAKAAWSSSLASVAVASALAFPGALVTVVQTVGAAAKSAAPGIGAGLLLLLAGVALLKFGGGR